MANSPQGFANHLPWPAPLPASVAQQWTLDPGVTYLNHGSYGACPLPVLDVQQELRARLERQPMHFMARELPPLWDEALATLARFVHCEARDLVFVPNATAGVNAVLRALRFAPSDELLTTQHAYNACRNALDYVASQTGARVVVACVPFPLRDASLAVDAVLGAVTAKTKLVLLDHVTSPTGLVFPLAACVAALKARGIDTLVDGAHALGMMPLNLKELGAAYYTANCHKWLCAPKGAAMLYVDAERQQYIQPLVVSHGYNAPHAPLSRFRTAFDWPGTHDPTAYLCVPAAINFMGALLPGGWPAIYGHNTLLVRAARRALCATLGCVTPAPDALLGSLASVPLPPSAASTALASPLDWPDPWQRRLWETYRIEVPVFVWPRAPSRYLRISAQVYNCREHYERLASALTELMADSA